MGRKHLPVIRVHIQVSIYLGYLAKLVYIINDERVIRLASARFISVGSNIEQGHGVNGLGVSV